MAAMRFATLSLVLSLAFVSPALAQDTDGDNSTPGADEYTQRVQDGIALLVSGDSSGAQSAFRDAIQMDGNRPQGPYYLAASNRMSGNFQDAVTGFERAADVAENEPRWRARALQGVAETLERMDGRLEDARTAWQAYVRFADSNTTVAFSAMGRARVQAIDVMVEQERAYPAVRQRIAERERIARESN